MQKTASITSITGAAVLALISFGTMARGADEKLARLPAASEEAKKVATGGNEFATKLYGQLKDAKGNLFFSPYSISAALSMANEGAGGSTREQIAKALGLPERKEALAGFESLYARLQASKEKTGIELAVANRLWPSADFEMNPEFVKQTADIFHTGLEALDFSNSSAAAGKINLWVDKETRQKIRSVVTAEAVSKAKLVLTNAIYFKGDWTTQFKEAMTANGDFWPAVDRKVTARMMKVTSNFGHAIVPAAGGVPAIHALEMTYARGDISMLVLMPKIVDFPAMEAALSPRLIEDVNKKISHVDVDVTFPKFKMESSFELKKALAGTGIVDAFDQTKADFTGISSKQGLFVSSAMHKAYVSVDEKGTEAAAVTAVTIQTVGRPITIKPVPFSADHPFIFVLQDKGSGAILFIGRVTDPTK
jgi:serpin B